MNNLKNRVQLIGYVGVDPEVKKLESGKTVATFRIATNETYKDSNGNKVEDTQWHDVVAWGKQAEVIEQYLRKGKEIALDGKLMHRTYDAKDGSKRYVTEVKMNDFVFLGKKEVAA